MSNLVESGRVWWKQVDGGRLWCALAEFKLIMASSGRMILVGVGGFWPVLMGALMWWVPLAVWVLGGVWALSRIWTGERPLAARLVWSLIVVAVPTLGVVAFAAFGNREHRLVRRLTVALGGTVLWLGALVAALLIGGVF